jgi:hypothetical protein
VLVVDVTELGDADGPRGGALVDQKDDRAELMRGGVVPGLLILEGEGTQADREGPADGEVADPALVSRQQVAAQRAEADLLAKDA